MRIAKDRNHMYVDAGKKNLYSISLEVVRFHHDIVSIQMIPDSQH